MQPSLFTRLTAAEAELQAMKDRLAELLDGLAEVKATQEELRQDHDEWRWWAENALTSTRKSWWRRLIGRIRVSDPDRLKSLCDNALHSNRVGLILRILGVVFAGLLFWQAVFAAGKL